MTFFSFRAHFNPHLFFVTCFLVIVSCLLLPQKADAAFTETYTAFGGITNNTQTWAATPIGTANAARKVVVFIEINENGNASANDGAPTAVTIGGITATKVADNSFSNGSNNSQSVTVWTAAVPTGTTADVVASGIPSANYNGGIAVLTTTDNINISTVYDSAFLQQDSDGGSMNIDVPTNGLAAGAGVTWPDFAGHTWTGLTEQDEVTDGGDNYWSVATYQTVGAQASRAVSVSYGAEVSNFVTVSFAVPVALSRPANKLGLVGYWSFDEGSGTVATDFSGYRNAGTLTAGPTWVDGKRGKALNFDGTDDMVEVLDADSIDSGLISQGTIAAWIRSDVAINGANGGYGIVGKDNQSCNYYSLFVNPSFGSIGLVTTSACGFAHISTLRTQWAAGTWYHVVATWTPSGKAIYVDGVLDNSNANTDVFGPGTDPMIIGRTYTQESSNDEYWDGLIDEVRIYNRALGPTEIAALAKSGSVKFTNSSAALQSGSSLSNGLVGLWTFDGAAITANQVLDQSGQGNHGGFFGGATSSAKAIGKLGQALQFDGVNDYVNISNQTPFAFDRTSAFTLAAWVKPTVDGTEGEIISKFAGFIGYSLAYQNGFGTRTGQIVFGMYGTGGADVFTNFDSVTEGQWVHVVATNDGTGDASGMRVYLNGVDRTTPLGDDLVSSILASTPVNIGAANAMASYAGATIDDARIYNRALTPAEAKQLYRLGQGTIRE